MGLVSVGTRLEVTAALGLGLEIASWGVGLIGSLSKRYVIEANRVAAYIEDFGGFWVLVPELQTLNPTSRRCPDCVA